MLRMKTEHLEGDDKLKDIYYLQGREERPDDYYHNDFVIRPNRGKDGTPTDYQSTELYGRYTTIVGVTMVIGSTVHLVYKGRRVYSEGEPIDCLYIFNCSGFGLRGYRRVESFTIEVRESTINRGEDR